MPRYHQSVYVNDFDFDPIIGLRRTLRNGTDIPASTSCYVFCSLDVGASPVDLGLDDSE